MTPHISVVMPVRDGARWLGEAITSVQDQTLADFELIIVDDGSADNSPHIIEAGARSDPRIRAIRQERLGLVAALNRGVSESRGHLIARLDADDRAQPQRLQRQSEYLDRHSEIGLLGTWAEQIDEQGSAAGSLKPPTRPEELASLLARTNPFVHSSIMVRAAIFPKIGLYRQAFEGAEDYDLWLRISEIAKIANVPECLVQYRVHRAGETNRSRVRQLFSARLAQRAAHARRAGKHDPTSHLAAAPNWHDADSANSPIYGDIARLFRFLDSANSGNISGSNASDVDISALSDSNIVLNHAERRMAQLALLNMLKQGATLPNTTRVALLWHFVRLHPLRAAQLGYQALQKS